jgi:multidrug efflux system membrane fusion protein
MWPGSRLESYVANETCLYDRTDVYLGKTICSLEGRRLKRTRSTVLLAISLSFGTSCTDSRRGSEVFSPSTVVPVTATSAVKENSGFSVSGPGTVMASHLVTIKSRVDGQILEMPFEEGQEVRKGDLLVVIDPAPYEATLSQLEANLFKDEASLDDAKSNLQRDQALFAAKVISQQQLSTQVTSVNQLEGAVRADKAQIGNANLNLSYTRIVSPVGGRVGFRLVDPGNIVRSSDGAGLLTVMQLQPVEVIFAISQESIGTLARFSRGGRSIPVEVYTQDDLVKLSSGEVLAFDNEVDPSTGTVKLKATVDNRNRTLWPNEPVSIHLRVETTGNNIVVPGTAIRYRSGRTFVFLLRPDNTVELRKVTVGSWQGNNVAINSGLVAGDLVVIDSLEQLENGTRVKPRGQQRE